jgi:acyl-CoA thioester hydrolase
MSRKPIVYRDLVDIRFADLDMYGHVNAKHYLDFVATARLNFMQREMKTSPQDVAASGIGFFLTQSLIQYKRSINGLQRILCESHIENVRDGVILEIPFVLKSEDGRKLYSDGVLEYTLVDLKSRQKTTITEKLENLFFETLS